MRACSHQLSFGVKLALAPQRRPSFPARVLLKESRFAIQTKTSAPSESDLFRLALYTAPSYLGSLDVASHGRGPLCDADQIRPTHLRIGPGF